MAQIALTTVFTPPASCLDNSYTSYAASVYVKDVNVRSSACYPEGFQALWSLGEPFSPGVCLESYAAVSSSTTGGESGPSGRDETRVLCCPGSTTARGAELGCYTDVEDETVLALPTGAVTVEGALLAIHGVLVAWASSDLAVLPAVPGSLTTTTGPRGTSSKAQSEDSTTPPASSVTLVSSALSTHTLTITPLVTTITESTTQEAESQVSDPIAGDATPMAQETFTPEASPIPPPESTTSTSSSPSASLSTTTHPTPHLPPSTIAGTSIGAAASLAILAGLIAWAIVFCRRRRRRRSNEVDGRGFDSAAEFQEDKRRRSRVSSSFGTASCRGSGSGSGRGRTEVSEADSRAVLLGAVELEGE